MTVTVIFSSLHKKITVKITVHYDVYCDFSRYEVKDSENNITF